ncbi:hypothetical protein [Heterosigma akashiwo virus 01]|jgi:hypothetical protein|uniref:Uncharacterized protein n=1 Tax=Heterosigma akashiwo virus 01 TaxID=97195 RepID=A0A1C9C4X3_HAV01|nr:hypothetical protein D1R72_gp005 [Heterosigma akashiwo virus 01]AOM63336.1 hypothetical protein [Heterosigma akashiwo virus 01]
MALEKTHSEIKTVFLHVYENYTVPDNITNNIDPGFTQKMFDFISLTIDNGKNLNVSEKHVENFINENSRLQYENNKLLTWIDETNKRRDFDMKNLRHELEMQKIKDIHMLKENMLGEYNEQKEKFIKEIQDKDDIIEKGEKENIEKINNFKNRWLAEKAKIIEEEKKRIQDELKDNFQTLINHNKELYENRIKEKDRMLDMIKEQFASHEAVYCSQIDNLRKTVSLCEERLSKMDNDQAKQLTSINETVMSFKSSNIAKGDFGEFRVREFLEDHFPEMEITDTSASAQCGDIHLSYDNMKFIVEVKTKQKTTKTDIDKFERDIHDNSDFDGYIMLASSANIPTKGCYELYFYNDKPVLYISKIFDQPYIIKLGITIILRVAKRNMLINKNNDECDPQTMEMYDNIKSTLESCYNTINCMTSSNKAYAKIIDIVKTEKTKTEQYIETSRIKIEHLLIKYNDKLKMNNVVDVNRDVHDKYFEILYETKQAIIKETGRTKIVYKEILQRVAERDDIDISLDYLKKKYPKTKFDTLCKQRDLTSPV